MAVVGQERRDDAMRYRQDLDRRLNLAAYMLLQQAMRLEFGIERLPRFSYGPNGKPFFAEYPDIHFNLSHCREAAACVVATQPVGIDVECVDSYDKQLLPLTMNEAEQQFILSSSHPAISFIGLWTIKESLLKLTGQGITSDLHSILSHRDDYRFDTAINTRYIYTVCTHAKSRSI